LDVKVGGIATLDRHHCNGDPFWDGDQTLHRLQISDGSTTAEINVVTPRGDAFVSDDQIRRFVEMSFASVSHLLSRARRPGPGRQMQVALPIEPGF
jgi:hypothetical protein